MYPGYYEYREQQYAAALPLLEPIAERGNSEAQSMLGFIYQLGLGGVEVCEETAIVWYERSSAQGNNLAMILLLQGKLEASKRLQYLAREQGFMHGPALDASDGGAAL